MHFTKIHNNGFTNISVFVDGKLLSADSTHPNFEKIEAKLDAQDESGLAKLFDLTIALQEKFKNLSERLSLRGGKVFFDGEAVDGRLERQIVRFIDEEDAAWEALVNFYEKLASNPSSDSREQLYTWLEDKDFSILPDGNFIAYKGVKKWANAEENLNQNNSWYEWYSSINSGYAIVDGVEYNGYIPNYVGAIVEMPRSGVEANASVGCSTGLHVANWNYANDWSKGHVLEVTVNPRDVVSVPTDCNVTKMRVCRYKVLSVIEKENTDAFRNLEFDEDDYADWDADPDYF